MLRRWPLSLGLTSSLGLHAEAFLSLTRLGIGTEGPGHQVCGGVGAVVLKVQCHVEKSHCVHK